MHSRPWRWSRPATNRAPPAELRSRANDCSFDALSKHAETPRIVVDLHVASDFAFAFETADCDRGQFRRNREQARDGLLVGERGDFEIPADDSMCGLAGRERASFAHSIRPSMADGVPHIGER